MRYYRPKHATVLRDGTAQRVDYAELDHCCENFALVDDWLDEPGLQRRGYVGHARARLARSRDIVRVAIARLHIDDTVFLHAPGLCAECDDARHALAPAI
jgi:aminoglycoside 3-N-acetyltransferase